MVLTVQGRRSPSSSVGGTDMCTALVEAEARQPVLPVPRVSQLWIQRLQTIFHSQIPMKILIVSVQTFASFCDVQLNNNIKPST